MMFLGVDAGSAYIKFALLDENYAIKGIEMYKNIGNELTNINKRIEAFLLRCSDDRSDTKIAACGYGRENVNNAEILISEITAIAKGVSLANNAIDCVIDIGAQDFKVIRILQPQGKVLQFYMNDRCSSGTGAFISTILERLNIPVNEVDDYYFEGSERVRLSATCTVFATSEAIGYLSKGESVDSVLRGAIDVLVRKISPMVQRFDDTRNFTLTGGLSNVRGIVDAFDRALESEYVPLEKSNYMGAIGAGTSILEKKNQY
jgi:predicted CoA-substrate-specific enzyme activase